MKRSMMAGVMVAFMLSGCSAILPVATPSVDTPPKEITPTATRFCGPHDEIAAALLKGYSEKPVAMGLETTGTVVEVFSSLSRSWTVLITNPAGMSCAMAAGENWELIPEEPAGEGT